MITRQVTFKKTQGLYTTKSTLASLLVKAMTTKLTTVKWAIFERVYGVFSGLSY